jgi:hypothetical protein
MVDFRKPNVLDAIACMEKLNPDSFNDDADL